MTLPATPSCSWPELPYPFRSRLTSFKDPDLLQHGPIPFWFWNDRLEEKEMRRQVRLMHDGGLRTFIIHARWGLKTPYLSRLWWRQVKIAMDEAKKRGMQVWAYDEYNYPSGICGFKVSGQQRFRERYLSNTSIEGKGTLQLKLPKGALLGVYAYPFDQARLDVSRAIDLGSQVKRGRLVWNAPDQGTWKLHAFAMRVETFGGSGKYSINYLAPEPTREFIRLTHDAYARELGKDLGSVIPAFFLDEPRFNNALPWDERFPSWFKARKRYDLLPKLALLLDPGDPALTAKVRQDYHGLVSDLYCENFFAPVHAWCLKHKVKLVGHLMAEETLAGQTRFSGHGLKPYAHFDIPGSDHLGKGIGGLAQKMVASMAAHQGADRVLCEVFAGCGQDFSVFEMNAITHWLYSQGINLIVPHAFLYARRTKRQKDDWPPSMFFQWKHWKDYPAYAARVARLSEQLSGGKQLADIALFHPGEAFQAAYVPNLAFRTGYFKNGPEIKGKQALELESWFQTSGQKLSSSNRDYHVINAATLKNLGRYRFLLLPSLDVLDPASLKKVKAWGGKVLVKEDPKALIQSLTRIQKNPDVLLSGSKYLESKHFEWDSKIHDPYLHQNLETLFKKKEGGVQVLHYRKPGEDLYFFANLIPKEMRFKARLRSQAKNNQVELRWPGSGETNQASVRRLARGVSELNLKLPALESLLVVFKR